jgi:tripartite-type tricarboxylate transporter receptor subunit TctC
MRAALGLCGVFTVWCWGASAAEAPARPPFFQGKTINMIINFSAGGPTDTEGRLVARHLADHIPGNPIIIVRNMGGAGGAIGVNYVGEVAPPDGLTFGYTTGMAFVAAIKEPSLKVDITRMPLIAAGSGVSVVYIRSDYGGGVNKPSDVLSKSGFWVAGLSPDSDKDIRMRMQFDLLGLKYKYLTGYPGTADIRLAIQRNEVQATAESMPAYRASVEPLVAKGEITPLWYDNPASEGASRSPDTAGIPATSFLEFYKQHKKPDPQSLLYRSFLIANDIGTALQRLVLMPPGSPPEAVAALRAGFAGLGNDPSFSQDAMRTIKFVPRFDEGGRSVGLVKSALKPDPAIVAFIQSYIQEGEGGVRH